MQAEQLQTLVEFDEFLSFVSSTSGEQLSTATGPLSSLSSTSGRPPLGGVSQPGEKDPLGQVNELLDTWQHRWPSWEHDRVGVWDDVVRNRALCLDKMKGHMGMLAQVGAQQVLFEVGLATNRIQRLNSNDQG
jgi:hypothetical protein